MSDGTIWTERQKEITESIIAETIQHVRDITREALAAMDEADWDKVKGNLHNALIGSALIQEAIKVLDGLKAEEAINDIAN